MFTSKKNKKEITEEIKKHLKGYEENKSIQKFYSLEI